jgi:hypothetical protein
VRFWRKIGPKPLEREGDFLPRTFGLISLVCGFDPNSTVPEVRRVRGYGPGAARIFASRPLLIALLTARRSGVLQCSNRKGCDQWPLAGPDCSVGISFAIRLGSVLGFAGVG